MDGNNNPEPTKGRFLLVLVLTFFFYIVLSFGLWFFKFDLYSYYSSFIGGFYGLNIFFFLILILSAIAGIFFVWRIIPGGTPHKYSLGITFVVILLIILSIIIIPIQVKGERLRYDIYVSVNNDKFEKAIKSNNPEICNNLDEDYVKWYPAGYHIGVEYGNPDNGVKDKQSCLAIVAFQTKDYSLCNQEGLMPGQGYGQRQGRPVGCLTEAGILAKSITPCVEFSNGVTEKEECLLNVARALKDPTICEQITTNKYWKGLCKEDLS